MIAIKAELAGRLLPGAPERAANEVAELETVARCALREVREAVSGYRRPTLEGELEGARMALAAAGIVAEIEIPGASGLDAAEALAAQLSSCRVLILTTFGRPGYLRGAMEGGAAGFLLKDEPASELAAAIRRALAGERIVDPGLAAAALSQGECPLTPREHEVLAASRRYATVAELAQGLYLSHGTVRNHLSSVMQKLDARNRGEAVRIAEENGWL